MLACIVGSAGSSEPSTEDPVSLVKPKLLDLLALEEAGRDVFRASTVFPDPINLYGGQVAAQALRAAGMTVDPVRVPHSLHCYFLRAGDPLLPVDYYVHRDRDGRSYSARTVSAMQDGREILIMSTSFHVLESGPDEQGVRIDDVKRPHEAEMEHIELRTCDVEYLKPKTFGVGDYQIDHVWTRAAVELGDDPLLHACVVTYISDMFTGLFTLVPRNDGVLLSSLDHAIWFLRPAKADDWMYMQLQGESLNDGRGLYSGEMFDSNGAMVAKLMQESLYRPHASKG